MNQPSIKQESTDNLIPSRTPDGRPKMVAKEKCIFRPSVYGLIICEKGLLVTVSRTTGLYKLPGGGIHLGERMEDALKREILEECGITATVDGPAFFKEDFFYFEDKDIAWQAHLFFFNCTPGSLDVTDNHNDPEDESCAPLWVKMDSLKPGDFQFAGEEVIRTVLPRIGMGGPETL